MRLHPPHLQVHFLCPLLLLLHPHFLALLVAAHQSLLPPSTHFLPTRQNLASLLLLLVHLPSQMYSLHPTRRSRLSHPPARTPSFSQDLLSRTSFPLTKLKTS